MFTCVLESLLSKSHQHVQTHVTVCGFVEVFQSPHMCVCVCKVLHIQHKPCFPRPINMLRHMLQYVGLLKCFSLHTCVRVCMCKVLHVQHKPCFPRPINMLRHMLQYVGLLKCFSLHTCVCVCV